MNTNVASKLSDSAQNESSWIQHWTVFTIFPDEWELMGEEPAGGPALFDSYRFCTTRRNTTAISTKKQNGCASRNWHCTIKSITGIGHSAEWSFIYWKALAPRYYTMELNSPKWLGSMSQRLFIPQYNTYPWVVPADQYIRIEVHWVSWLSGVVLKPQLWGGGAMRQLESPLVWTSSSRLAPPVPGRFWFSPSTVSQHLWVSSLGWADELPQVSDRTGFIAAGCRNIRHNNCGIWRLSQTSDWYVKVRTLLRCVVDGEWECRGCL